MVLVNFATKEIVAKLVYYGPALCGKTTNLQYIFTRLNPKKRGKMISLATESDRTLFFDFLPLEFGTVQGFKIRFQLYTVPGQVFYGATRKLVLKGADAIIFVADSQADVMDRNIESIEDMKANLIENGLDPETIPLIIQYNKRDLNNLSPLEELEEKVNYRGVPSFEASAVEGFGVMEAFKESTKLLLQELKRKHSFINIDSVKDLPDEVFEQKAEKVEEEVLDAEVEYELELGSSYGAGGGGDDVVAGELLDQIETISLTDSCQAEAFLDDYRKGVPTEEAKQKAEKVSVCQTDAGASTAMDKELFAAAWELQDQAGAHNAAGGAQAYGDITIDLSPVETSPAEPAGIELTTREEDFVINRGGISTDDMPPPPVLETFAEPEPAQSGGEAYLGMDMTSPEMMEPDGVVFEVEEQAPGHTAADFRDFVEMAKPGQVSTPAPAPLAGPGPAPVPEPRPMPVQRPAPEPDKMPVTEAAPAREAGPVPAAAAAPLTVDLSGLNAGLAGVMSAIEKLDHRVSDIGREVSGLKASIARHGHAADAPQPAPAQPQPVDMSARIDELAAALKDVAEGQDRLLLSILEAVREAKRSNHDSHEKMEDAVKYLIGKVVGEDKGPGKKKWF